MREAFYYALLCVCFWLLFEKDVYSKTMRTVEADDEKIIVVNTALGYSTILLFPSKPINAVLGDQDSFKLEFIGQSITIKPLIPNAKSNLFVFTEYERFNCTLRTSSASEVDYTVKIVPPRRVEPPPKPIHPRVKKINQSANFAGFSLKILSMVYPLFDSDSSVSIQIEFEISSKITAYQFEPYALGVRQGGRFLNVENLVISSLELIPKSSASHGVLSISAKELKYSLPFQVVFAVPVISKSKKPTIHRLSVTIGKKSEKQEESKKDVEMEKSLR